MHSLCNVRSVYLVFDTCMHFDNIQDNSFWCTLLCQRICTMCITMVAFELFLFDTNILKQSIPQSSMADGISSRAMDDLKAFEVNYPSLSVRSLSIFVCDCLSATPVHSKILLAASYFLRSVNTHENLVNISIIPRKKKAPPRLPGRTGPARSITTSSRV